MRHIVTRNALREEGATRFLPSTCRYQTLHSYCVVSQHILYLAFQNPLSPLFSLHSSLLSFTCFKLLSQGRNPYHRDWRRSVPSKHRNKAPTLSHLCIQDPLATIRFLQCRTIPFIKTKCLHYGSNLTALTVRVGVVVRIPTLQDWVYVS